MHLILAILILYTNGEPQHAEVLGRAHTMAECKQIAPQALASVAPKMPKDMQAVVKCVDFDEVPLAASVFGKADTL